MPTYRFPTGVDMKVLWEKRVFVMATCRPMPLSPCTMAASQGQQRWWGNPRRQGSRCLLGTSDLGNKVKPMYVWIGIDRLGPMTLNFFGEIVASREHQWCYMAVIIKDHNALSTKHGKWDKCQWQTNKQFTQTNKLYFLQFSVLKSLQNVFLITIQLNYQWYHVIVAYFCTAVCMQATTNILEKFTRLISS